MVSARGSLRFGGAVHVFDQNHVPRRPGPTGTKTIQYFGSSELDEACFRVGTVLPPLTCSCFAF